MTNKEKIQLQLDDKLAELKAEDDRAAALNASIEESQHQVYLINQQRYFALRWIKILQGAIDEL